MAIQLSKNGNAVKFDFDDNSHYLNDGTIEVPVNSLTLVTDESDMFTFKKACADDIFISGLYEEIGMSKSELIAWYKDNMVGSTGGGGGVTSGEVQTMIDESISGKADTSDVQNVASDVATVSGDVNTLSGSVNTLTGNVNTLSGDVSTLSGAVDSNHNAITAVVGDVQTLSGDVANKADTTAVTASINSAVSGKMDTSAFNTYSASTDARLSEDEEVTSAALNELNTALDDKADTTAVTESINAAVSGKADTSAVTASITAAVSGKQDTLVSGTNIKTINSESLLGSGNIDIQGGGKAIEAGRGIAITTGATADTVSLNLPISAGTGENSIRVGFATEARGQASLAEGWFTETSSSAQGAHSEGNSTRANGHFSHSEGEGTSALTRGSHSEGYNTVTRNDYEHSSGKYNNSVSGSSTFGDSGNTLFSVGNGTANNARHNAFEIRQNGDIYITKDGSDVKLQDQLGGGGLPESAFTAYTAATEARLAEDEEVTAASLNALNDAIDDKADASDLGGLKLVQLTQAQYDALTTKDASTLYIITNVVS